MISFLRSTVLGSHESDPPTRRAGGVRRLGGGGEGSPSLIATRLTRTLMYVQTGPGEEGFRAVVPAAQAAASQSHGDQRAVLKVSVMFRIFESSVILYSVLLGPP